MDSEKEQELEDKIFDETSSEEATNLAQDALFAEAREARRQASMPYIDHLIDAVVLDENGNPEFTIAPSDQVIIERHITYPSGASRWLDTRKYDVESIDGVTGDLSLYDPEMHQAAMSNFITGMAAGYKFKVPEKGVRLRGRGKSKPKRRAKAVKKSDGKRGNPGKPGIRRIYNVNKGTICTRLKGIAYVAPLPTQALEGEKLEVSAPTNGSVIVTHPIAGWSEIWPMREGM